MSYAAAPGKISMGVIGAIWCLSLNQTLLPGKYNILIGQDGAPKDQHMGRDGSPKESEKSFPEGRGRGAELILRSLIPHP